ncbi:MAG: helix-turn-helix transcriptional regulator [Oscillospiraceae bacterium]|nr:helix-turn-helix transcriptional regulator [Oscillospiraceae bacterium]
MEQVFLPGKVHDRIQDLMKSQKITQAELATRIGCSESMLSRFISGKTDKLGDENIIRIARVFRVSTDFLLGEVDIPDRVTYDISELGLSVQAARNLYTHKVEPRVVNALLENPEFANTTNLISSYLDDELTKGFAAQNQLYAMVAGMLRGNPKAVDDVKKLQRPVYQADLAAIQKSFMAAVQAIKKETGNDLAATRELTSQTVKKIYAELTKGQKKQNRKITPEEIGEAVAQTVSHLPGVDTERVKQMFLAMVGTVAEDEKGRNDQ